MAGCASATIDDEPRGVDPDSGIIKPPVQFPDAAVIVPTADAAPNGGEPDANCPLTSILVNGDFDSGRNVAWAESSTLDLPLVLDQSDALIPEELGILANSGTFLAYLAGYNSGTDLLSQDLTLPADAVGLRLSGVFEVATAESQDQVFDIAFVEIASTDDGETLEELTRFTNRDGADAFAPFEASASGNYAGQTIRVQLRAVVDDTLRTHFFFDTLVLEVATCSTPDAAPI